MGKNVFGRFLSMISSEDGVKDLVWFLRGYEIKLDQSYIDRIIELRDKFQTTINIDPATIPEETVTNEETGETETIKHKEGESMFSLDKKQCRENANTYIFIYIVADIEETWKKYGVADTWSRNTKAKKIIRGSRGLVKLDLQEKFDKTFVEIEKMIANLEATANGHPEGVYHNDESITDLTQRDVSIKPRTEDTEKPSEESANTEEKGEQTVESVATTEPHVSIPESQETDYEYGEIAEGIETKTANLDSLDEAIAGDAETIFDQ